MPRAGVTTEVVVNTADELIDEVGLENLTLALVAKHLNVQLPSLYKHIAGLQDLRNRLISRSQQELLDAMKSATIGRSERQALMGLATAARKWGLAHPGGYAITLAASHTPNDGSEEMLVFTLRIMESFGLHGDDAVDAARFLRATLDGFISLETRGGFGLPVSVNRSFERAIEGLGNQFTVWGK